MVYWTENPDARLCEWQKIIVFGRRVVFTELTAASEWRKLVQLVIVGINLLEILGDNTKGSNALHVF